MTLGSLFDGIGGFVYAASLYGIETIWASEISKPAISVTRRHFPNMVHVGDILNVRGGDLTPVDIITFGSPCQSFSIAGSRKGLEGKSGLFWEAIRVIREMREATHGRKPRFSVFENVPGILSANRGLDYKAVLEAFAEAEVPMPPSGRWANAGMVRGGSVDVAWVIHDAQHFGVAQRRRRLYAVCDFRGRRAAEILFKSKSLYRHTTQGETAREGITPDASGSIRSASRDTYYPKIIGTICASGAGLSRPAGMSSETDLCVVTENNLYPKDSSIYNLQGNMIGRDEKNGPRGMGINEGIAFTLNTVDKQAVATVFSRQRTDVYMENDVTSTQVARQNKDATDLVLEQSFALDCRNIRELTEISGTLMAKEGGGYSLNFQNPIRKGYIVRRLTPTECERLQGFRDGWTAFGHDGKPLSDSARYRALGNSVAIPCVAYVLSGIVDELQREQEGFDDDIRT